MATDGCWNCNNMVFAIFTLTTLRFSAFQTILLKTKPQIIECNTDAVHSVTIATLRCVLRADSDSSYDDHFACTKGSPFGTKKSEQFSQFRMQQFNFSQKCLEKKHLTVAVCHNVYKLHCQAYAWCIQKL